MLNGGRGIESCLSDGYLCDRANITPVSSHAVIEEFEFGREAAEPFADAFLAAAASIRRSLRRQAGRPVEFGSLTGSQLELVRLVRRRPGISVADAAKELRLASNTVSTLVGQLIHAGLVVRHIDSSDRRIARLELAEEIRGKVTAWRDRRTVVFGDAIASLPPDDRLCLARALPLLARLADDLEAVGVTR
jgi:DNA-binding MarR family transcriptional regulator